VDDYLRLQDTNTYTFADADAKANAGTSLMRRTPASTHMAGFAGSLMKVLRILLPLQRPPPWGDDYVLMAIARVFFISIAKLAANN